MTEFIIHYRSSDGTETTRRISDLEFNKEFKAVDAFCHLRNERRSFVFTRIIHATDAETGELVDLAAMLGVELPKEPEPRPFLRTEQEMALLARGSEEYKRQRNTEKRELYKPFQLDVVYEHFKGLLFQLFENRCAKCQRAASLNLDHHVPMILGGRLVPGNIGALCRNCNNAKSDRAPTAFYTIDELSWIEPVLHQQSSVLQFKFNWSKWREDRGGYLLSIGIHPTLVDEVLNNPHHRWYIREHPEIAVRFEIAGVTEFLKTK